MSVRFLRRKYIFHPLKKKKTKLGTTEFDQEQSPGRRSRGIKLIVLKGGICRNDFLKVNFRIQQLNNSKSP